MRETISIIGFVTNIILAALKIGAGIISKSAAVLAEGFHSGMDIVSSAISYIGIKVAKKPVDEEHPYGHYKSEVIAGFVITIILLLTALGIIYESVTGFFLVKELAITNITLGIIIFSAVINEIMVRLKIHYGKKEESMALIADAQHSRVDVFVSVGVLIGLFLINYWVHIDSLIALLIGVYILKESFSLGKKTTDSLLEVSAGKEVENKIKEVVKQEGITFSSLKTNKLGPIIFAELRIKLPSRYSVEEASIITKNLEERLTATIPSLKYIVIQIESHEQIRQELYKGVFGQRFGWQRKGRKGGFALGPGGECVCPKCGYKAPHQRGVPCYQQKCPKCGSMMTRSSEKERTRGFGRGLRRERKR